MHDDEALIPISALQHYLFCPRQCALIYIDGLWAENHLTAHGRLVHERVDSPTRRSCSSPSGVRREGGVPEGAPSSGVRVVHAMPLVARTLGLVGKADTVEFDVDRAGRITGPPRPVEHKRGRPKRIDADRVQVCAQGLCLEEMLGMEVPAGALFYHAIRRRETVQFDESLRALTAETIRAVRKLFEDNRTPRVRRQRKCANCSLVYLCLPGGTEPTRSPRRYLARSLAASLAQE